MPASRKPPSIGCLASHVGFHLRLAQLAVFEHFGNALKRDRRHPGDLFRARGPAPERRHHPVETRATVRLERSSMVPMLDKLSRRGLLERRASTTDRRHNHLHLTDAGRELLAEALRRASQHEKEVCKPFTIAEKKLLLELLGRFRASKKSESA
jgi:DNA-binding MarR family transcriptional regulator